MKCIVKQQQQQNATTSKYIAIILNKQRTLLVYNRPVRYYNFKNIF